MSIASGLLRRGPRAPAGGTGPRAAVSAQRARGIAGILGQVSIEDWVTAALLAGMLAAVSWAVQLSGWGDLPSLIPTALIATVAGFWAASSRAPWYVKHPAAIALGFAVAFWQGAIPADGGDAATKARDAWERLFEWVQAARTGGISTDSVPFALMMMAVTWVAAYVVSWVTFRFRNPWIPAMLLGVGLLTDLSYRQGKHEQTFFLFIMAAVALFAHLTAVRRTRRWRQAGTPYPRNVRWLAVRDGLVLGGLVVLIAALLPLLEVRSKPLNEQWKVLRRPLETLQEPATRLLSGVHGKEKKPPLTAPGDVLAFQGPLALTEDPVMWVTSRYPTLHAARIYQYYTPQGWLVGPRTVNTVPARAPSGVLPSDRARERIDQRIQPLYKTTTVMPVGGVVTLDRDSTVEVLEPPRYVIPLSGAITGILDMPRDVREVATELRLALQSRSGDSKDFPLTVPQLERALVTMAPDNLETTLLLHPDTGVPQSVVLERTAPFEQIGVKLSEDITAQDYYTVTTYVSLAHDQDLAGAGGNYPAWVTDRYMQLPSGLPARVKMLAQEIVTRAGAETPYEKALAIAAFLRSQVYSLEIVGPQPSRDGVDYFLFETRAEGCPVMVPDCKRDAIKGYSQYYGSAATVLMRAAGVPSRMIAGWSSGAYIASEGSFVIRDKDRHGWTQVYFPGYGWIDIEVTPGKSLSPRGQEFSTTPEPDLTRLIGGLSFEEDLLLRDIEEAERAAREAGLGLAVGGGSDGAIRVPPGVYYGFASLAGLLVLMYAAWWGVHRGMDPATRAYTQMVRAGWTLGVRRSKDQTAGEFAGAVTAIAPRAAAPAGLIASEYQRLVYARRATEPEAGVALGKAWSQVLRAMIGYRLGRLGHRFGERRAGP